MVWSLARHPPRNQASSIYSDWRTILVPSPRHKNFTTHFPPLFTLAVFRTQNQSYKADGISALASINDTHFEDFHLYSIEWQPGPEGYVSW